MSKQTPEELEWRIVFDTLQEAKKKLEADGVRHSWMDGAIDLAKERANIQI